MNPSTVKKTNVMPDLTTPTLKILTNAIKPEHAWTALLILVGLHVMTQRNLHRLSG